MSPSGQNAQNTCDITGWPLSVVYIFHIIQIEKLSVLNAEIDSVQKLKRNSKSVQECKTITLVFKTEPNLPEEPPIHG